jgi:tetratricopeptide (TPR) repeat protein
MHLFALRAALSALLIAGLGGSALAQGRVGGVVRDADGQPLKGATITAENPNVGQTFTATTDDRGRFTMLGLRAGQWRFVAQAPGYAPNAGEMPVRAGSPNPPITFALRKTGPATFGALGGIDARDLQEDLAEADALFNQQKWDDAIAAYRRIMSRAPALTVVNLQIAAAHRSKKDYDAALGAYGELLKRDPDNEKATLGIASTNVERGNPQAAEETLLQAADAPGAGREVFYQLAEVKHAKGEADAAAGWYGKAAAADPSWGKPLYKLGLHAMTTGDRGLATKYLTQAIVVDPVSPEAALAKSTLDQLNK